MKTRAAVLHRTCEPFRIEELDLEGPRAGEVLVRVQAAGVCHSDWHIATGDTKHPLPCVCGHEGAGVVEAIGPGVEGLKPGDFVALNWAPYCGTCFYCQGGRPCLCERYLEPIWKGTMMDGTPRFSLRGQPVFHYCALGCFAERIVVPAVSCVPLDPKVPPQIAALIGCAVTTGVGAAVNTAALRAGSSVAVFGAGGVGLSAIMGAKAAGATTIVAVDRLAEKAEQAKAFGATHALAFEDAKRTAAQIKAWTGGRGADCVFEAVGIPAVQEACLDAARPGGEIVLVGLAPMGTATNLPGALLTRRELTLKGSYYGTCVPGRDFPRFAAWYLEGKLDLGRLVSRTWNLDQLNEAFAEMLAGKVARGVVLL